MGLEFGPRVIRVSGPVRALGNGNNMERKITTERFTVQECTLIR
jgi:hypothetical protein